jgi:hypothetical protein
MTFSSEAGLLVSKNTKKQVSGALFALNSGKTSSMQALHSIPMT